MCPAAEDSAFPAFVDLAQCVVGDVITEMGAIVTGTPGGGIMSMHAIQGASPRARVWCGIRIDILAVAISCALVVLAQRPASAATAAQLCEAAKLKAAGKYAQCRLKADAKAAKAGGAADYMVCNAKLAEKFAKAETVYGVACPTRGDVSLVQSQLSDSTASVECQLAGAAQGPPGSIVVFPSLHVSASSDPTLFIRNVSNSLVGATCMIVNLTSGCSVSDFQLSLVLQEGLAWKASVGIPGRIPPLPEIPFDGEIVCVEIDASDVPLSGNHLEGAVSVNGGCPSAALSVAGNEFNDGDFTLQHGVEYDACPAGIDPSRIETCWSLGPFAFDCN
jgi:hypothetical protein